LQWSKQGLDQLLFSFWQDVEFFGTWQKRTIPNVIGLHTCFGVERIRHL